MKNFKSLISYIIALITIIILWYIILPVLRFNYFGIPLLITVFGLIVVLIDSALTRRVNLIGSIILTIGILFMTVIPFITSSAIFNADEYRNIIGEIKEGDFTEDLSPIDITNLRLVDEEMALRLGDKKIGQDPALGSQATLSRFNIQKVNGKLFWISPLQHRSFFKWRDNSDGTRGYIMVSASNPQDVKLVQKVNDKNLKIKYQPGAFFGDDLKRHIYKNGYNNIGLTDYTFEIDESGKPYWVVTLFEKRVGFSGEDATGVLIVDAQTGKIEEYDINNAPEWVDRIQPEEFIETQLNDWGIYIKGWLNSFLAEEEVLEVTPGISLVYGKDNNSYWYTGITSSGSDESTIGFVLVNTRTKEAKLYRQSGATETAAMSSAEGKVQEKNYVASFPIMYNILGVPTYVCSLKDKAGLIKMVAMISVEDYSILGIGETKQDALRAYRSSLKSKGNFINIEEDVDVEEIEGKVLRFSTDIRNGESYYYLIVSGIENKIFIGTSNTSQELPLTNVGDTVYVRYDLSNSVYIDITEFDNRSLDLK